MIEILVVIGIIAILATIVIIAINPARQFAQGRNSQRTSNVTAILNAVGQRIADNKGVFEGTLNGVTCPTITTTVALVSTLDNCLVPTYLSAVLRDPKVSGGGDYTIVASTTGRITVAAPSAELGETISVTR